MFAHPDDAPFWVSGQLNSITQASPGFSERYHDTIGDPLDPNCSGVGATRGCPSHSFQSNPQMASSVVATLYTGIPVARWTAVLVDVELASGTGLSTAFGLAGFTDLDVVRNPSLGSEPYLGRAIAVQIIPLSSDRVDVVRGPLQPWSKLPTERLELRAGKLGTVDFFDQNSGGSDSHLQFLNWTVDNNGAFDYAADTRGYTYGLELEYQSPTWGVRVGEMLMPVVANGIVLDWNVTQSRGENLEVEVRYRLAAHPGTARLLGYQNHAAMGSYREALDAYAARADRLPDGTVAGIPLIELHRAPSRVKWGLGLSLEQDVGAGITAFARLGWNDGQTESFAYTEVDNTVLLGAVASGGLWQRVLDRAGIAFVSNGISDDHRAYLAAGGHGFLLGDGALTYARETIGEAFYTAHLWRGLFVALDAQALWNPGYNQDRGPVLVGSFRVHLDL